MEDDDEEEEICKIVLLGESGVGKTCIISRFINNTFEEGLMSTNGASYASKSCSFPEYENRTIKFEVWDTAGQEKYRALNQIFYKDASICILVYDITNESSFKALQDYWFQQVKESAPRQTQSCCVWMISVAEKCQVSTPSATTLKPTSSLLPTMLTTVRVSPWVQFLLQNILQSIRDY